jgi:hypothetical protein
MKKSFHFQKKVWLWPGENAPWHFVYVDGKEKDTIKKTANKHHMGMVRVKVKIRKTEWETSLLPHKREDCYLLALKKEIRNKEGIMVGDTIDFTVRIP